MDLKHARVGFALTGSFCTLQKTLSVMQALKQSGAVLYPILSDSVADWDTKFGEASVWRDRITAVCGRAPVTTVVGAEPIGPGKLLDLLIIAPCTGNTLGKLSHGITDTAPTMAAKAHLRNGRPVLIAPSTNDGLAASAENIGRLMNRKHIYFVPFYQDDPANKKTSLVFDSGAFMEAARLALMGEQMMPVLLQKPDSQGI